MYIFLVPVRAGLGSIWYVETGGVGTEFRPEASNSVGMFDSWWKEPCLYF